MKRKERRKIVKATFFLSSSLRGREGKEKVLEIMLDNGTLQLYVFPENKEWET